MEPPRGTVVRAVEVFGLSAADPLNQRYEGVGHPNPRRHLSGAEERRPGEEESDSRLLLSLVWGHGDASGYRVLWSDP
ncbi:hypothetical protein ABT235_05425 [Micromonospora echinofusca]|uniref:hypothetical protein n=1 Tax=Micromonospora echinofusca TaxID=47858 RepID=UPI002021098B|nr:hypothetical protein [Micromonospora sp. MSM11]MCL7459642.1 hypothetical protein [Micromonospora sp. MSM11]